MNTEPLKTCFAIMPFRVRGEDLPKYNGDANHWVEVYHGLIQPAILDAGLRAQRDDDDYSSRLVVEGIWAKIEQADLVLCDLSSHNPNVHLELGWALRANKKLALVKDELTTFSFDLNQYYTLEYSSRLQPTTLRETVTRLSATIQATLADTVGKYSMVQKLSLRERVADAASEGSLEVRLLDQLLNEVQSLRRNTGRWTTEGQGARIPRLDSDQLSDLSLGLIGTTWRKDTGLEEILFVGLNEFVYTSVGTREWRENTMRYELSSGLLILNWAHDGFVSQCRFDPNFQNFSEQDGATWHLVANRPYVHPSFGKSSK